MKKLLTIFNVFALSLSPILTVHGCSKNENHFADAGMYELNKDIETMNGIMEKTRKKIKEWWDTKTEIDINTYSHGLPKFMEFVTKLKQNNNELILTGSQFYQWNFLNQLITEFKKIISILNQEFINKYSNFYYDNMPLSLDDNDIQINLKLINFNNLKKLSSNANHTLEVITINFDISYFVKYKEMTQPVQSRVTILVTNNLSVLNLIQTDLANYFVDFIDKLFKKDNYQIIDRLNWNFNDINESNTILQLIIDELNAKKINFKMMDEKLIFNTFYHASALVWNFKKEEDSVLAWAGEGYDSTKLTKENFLQFYKDRYFKNIKSIKAEGNNYYIKADVTSFILKSFMFENLVFKNKEAAIQLKTPIKILVSKAFIDKQLDEFAKKIMKFWNYYKIETYKNKIVFNVIQKDFKYLLNNIQNFRQKDSFLDNITNVFRYLFPNKNDLKLILGSVTNKGWMNLTTTSNSFLFNFIWMPDNYGRYPELVISFMSNSFSYGLFIDPVPADNKEENIFWATIEFKII